MRKTKRYPVLGLLAVAGLSISGGIGVAAADDDNGDGKRAKTVRTVGEDSFKPNEFVKSTLRFSPGRIRVRQGATVTWQDRDGSADPHTVTVLAEDDVPATVEEVFTCGEPGGPCEPALSGHFPSETAPLVPVLNAGQLGLDTVGDSLFLADGGEISAEISAPPRTTLNYVCAIHPWMQGSIKVR
jgi:plastocyanin